MKNTPENRAAVNAIIDTARIKGTGYQIKLCEYDDFFCLSVLSALEPLSVLQGPSVGRPKAGVRRLCPKVGFAFDSEQVGLSYNRIS